MMGYQKALAAQFGGDFAAGRVLMLLMVNVSKSSQFSKRINPFILKASGGQKRSLPKPYRKKPSY